MKNPFSKEPIRYQVIEVEKPRLSKPFDKDIANSLLTLQGHPGFLWLLDQLRLERSYLQTILGTRRQKTLTDAEFLQAGIAWSGWLQDKMERAIGFREGSQEPQEASDREREAFEAAQKFIEVLR